MGFENELRRAKRETELEETRRKAEESRRDAKREREWERERQKTEEERRRFIRRHIGPVKPMVDRLMRDLGRATWPSFAFEYHEEISSYEPKRLATWTVGRTRTIGGFFGKWKAGLNPKDGSWSYMEYFGITLCLDNEGRLVIDRVQEDNGMNENNLKRVLKEMYLNGPSRSYPSTSEGGVHGLGG
ncbi:MAG: hypothetical protein M1372_00025 [Patescibacteria group bacterium]|nr:hypothetical protein [Patescibacteria group bacterium]